MDAVFISHGTVAYCGALPLLHKLRWRSPQGGVHTPQKHDSSGAAAAAAATTAAVAADELPKVYCTHATQRLGRVATEAALLAATDCFCTRGIAAAAARGTAAAAAAAAAATATEGLQSSGLPFTVSDVNAAFAACSPIYYHGAIPVKRRRRRCCCCCLNSNSSSSSSSSSEDSGGSAVERASSAAPSGKCCCCAQQQQQQQQQQQDEECGVYVRCVRSGLNIGGSVWIVESDRLRIVIATGHSTTPFW